MKECFLTIGSFLLALALLVLEALLWVCCGLPYLLWKKLSYEAQCLRWSGGGWSHSMKEGARARVEKDGQEKPDRL